MKRLTTRAKALVAVGALAVSGVAAGTIIPATIASANPGTGVVATGAGVPLSVNDAPRLQSNRRGWAQPGERLAIKCQVVGDAVDGPWGRNNLWDYVEGRGYVSDSWVNTGTNARVAPNCDGAPQPPRPPAPADNGQMYLPFAQGASFPVTQQPFGAYTHNPNNPIGKYNMHAIDFGTPDGTPLYAPATGTVRYAAWDPYGYGNKLLVDHGNNRCSVFGHLSRIDVARGAQIRTGQFLGRTGNTGNSTGAHLHWGIVACDTGLSIETPNTVETGRNFALSSAPTSQNPAN